MLVGGFTKSFMIQADLRIDKQRTSIRMKVGEAGEMSAREARAKAKGLLGQIASGSFQGDCSMRRRAATGRLVRA